MAESPTYSEVVKESALIEKYVPDESTMSEYIARALADVKLSLLNDRGVKWSTVYSSANSDYFADLDGNENNKTVLIKAICLMTIAIIYKDNAQNATDDYWWDFYEKYRGESESLISHAKLDIDSDESGAISAGEEGIAGQVFFRS